MSEKLEKTKRLIFERVHDGRSFAVYTEDGDLLAGQRKTELVSDPDDLPEIVVRFVVDGKYVKVKADSGR